jgi:hypothetical protein
MVGFAVGLLPQGAMAIDLACQEKLDKALMTPFTDQATREVETFSVDGKALSRLTTEYLPVGIKKFTSENKLVPDTDPIWEKTTPVEDKRKLKDSTTIMTKDQTFENGVALYAAHKETEDPAFLAYLEAVKGGAPFKYSLFARECTIDSFIVDVDFINGPRPTLDVLDISAQRLKYMQDFDSMNKEMLFEGKVKLDSEGRLASFVFKNDSLGSQRTGVETSYSYEYDDSIQIDVPK